MRLSTSLVVVASVATSAQAHAGTRQAAANPPASAFGFDLTSFGPAPRAIRQNDRLPDPQPPQGTDLRLIAFHSPELDLPLGDGGPVMTMGALGSRYRNMPSLVHVGVAWNF